MIKGIIQSVFRKFGFQIRRVSTTDNQFNYNDQMRQGLERFKNLGLEIKTVVDVGAAQGYWSLTAKALWPDASFLLFEPLVERKVELERIVKLNPSFFYAPYAAGKESGIASFYVADDLDGSGVAFNPSGSNELRSVEIASIVSELQKHHLEGPYIIKLDTHGYELPIIEGCVDLLKDVSCFIIECYGFQIANNSLLMWQMCEYMERLGFRLFDVVDVMHRPKDGAFWQCDLFFIKSDHPLFQDNSYR